MVATGLILTGCGGPNVPTVDSYTLADSELKCARMKNGNIIQYYDGFLKNGQVWINNKNYTRKYKVTLISVDEVAQSGAKGFFCNTLDGSSSSSMVAEVETVAPTKVTSIKVTQEEAEF